MSFLTREEVIRYIQKNEEENWLAECMYFGALKGLRETQNDLSGLDDLVHIERILKPFLIQWGMMSRTLARKDVKWTQLSTKLRELEPDFKTLRGERLLHMRFEDEGISVGIKKVYEELDSVKYIGPTAVSKILHLINPEIFIMWDGEICKMYNVKGSATGYLKFLRKNQRLIKNVFSESECAELRSRFNNKTLAKLIDEFNWYIANEERTGEISEIHRKIKRSYDC